MFRILILILTFSSAVHCHYDIINQNFCSGIKPQRIRGTDLKTGTFYKVTTTNSNTHQMIWSTSAHSTYGYRYIKRDVNFSSLYKYEKGGSKYFDSQWFFLPAKGHTGWYHLANRKIPGEFAAWSHGETYRGSSDQYFLILDPSYSPETPKPEFLLKPVKEGAGYLLKSKSLPHASIATSTTNNIYADNVRANSVKFKQGGEWYGSNIFHFQPVYDETRLQASVTKIEILCNFTRDNNGTSIFSQEELATKSIILNNGASTLTEEYFGRKEIAENVLIHRPVNFTNFYKVGVEDAVEIEGNPGIPFLKTPTFNQQLISFYSADHESTPTWNYTQSRDFHTNQTIEVSSCTEYEVTANVNIVKDYPMEYMVYFKVTGDQDGEQISSVDLRDEHFNQDEDDGDANSLQVAYLDILDEYTILSKAKAKMWVTFARDSTVDGKGSKIPSCVDEYVCNQVGN